MNSLFAAILLSAVQADEAFESRLLVDRERILERGGGTPETEAAVRKALEWLSRNQKADGSWEVPDKDHAVGVTALAVLAFLGAGHAPKSAPFGNTIQSGLKSLLALQDAEGCVGPRVTKYMYDHIVATIALAEAKGMGSPEAYGKPAQKAVDFLLAAQNPGQGWRYSPKSIDSDTSVTGWAVLALRAAERAGLSFPRPAYEGALAWFDAVNYDTVRTGYTHRGPRVKVPGHGIVYDTHETMTAMAILGRFLIQKHRNDARLAPGLDLILKDLPRWEKTSVDFIYWHVATLAMFEVGGRESLRWKAWNEALQKVLLNHQSTEGDKSGSWEPADDWSRDGGRAYATALNALTLETYYRYVRTFRGDEK